jgi:hypothetical protein
MPVIRSGLAVYSGVMTHEELIALADAWIIYHLSAKGSPEREAAAWATDVYDLEYHDPETLWLLIMAIHEKDQSPRIQENLSAGPVEDLLAKHGEQFIARVEAQARRPRPLRSCWGEFGRTR